MKDKLLLFLYILLVVLITSYHHIFFLAGMLTILSVLSGSLFSRLIKKSFVSVILFNTVISIGYIVTSTISNNFSPEYVVLINLRVLTLTFMTFLLVERINLFKTLSFSRTLTFILVIAVSQILEFRKVYEDFKHALKSRTMERVKKKNLYRYIASRILFFLNKSIYNSREITQAMKSRGFFYD